MAIVKEEEKRNSESTHPGGSTQPWGSPCHPLQHLQEEQSPAPVSGIPGAGIQHKSL